MSQGAGQSAVSCANAHSFFEAVLPAEHGKLLTRGGPDNLFVWVPAAQEAYRHAMSVKDIPKGL